MDSERGKSYKLKSNLRNWTIIPGRGESDHFFLNFYRPWSKSMTFTTHWNLNWANGNKEKNGPPGTHQKGWGDSELAKVATAKWKAVMRNRWYSCFSCAWAWARKQFSFQRRVNICYAAYFMKLLGIYLYCTIFRGMDLSPGALAWVF